MWLIMGVVSGCGLPQMTAGYKLLEDGQQLPIDLTLPTSFHCPSTGEPTAWERISN